MTTAPAKTRADAWGESLPEEIRWEIYNLTKPPREGDGDRPHLRSYDDAREHAAARGIPPPSRAGWYRFLARMRTAEHLRLVYRVAGSGETADAIVREARIDDATAAEAFRALSVNAAMDGDDKGAALYSGAAAKFRDAALRAGELALRERAQAVKEEELKIAQEKLKLLQAKEAKAGATLADETLTPAEREARLKEIFGI